MKTQDVLNREDAFLMDYTKLLKQKNRSKFREKPKHTLQSHCKTISACMKSLQE